MQTNNMTPSEDHEEMLRLLRENNELLKKLYRHNIIGFGVKLVWFAILIGLPLAAYYYVLEPYFTTLGSNYDLFRQGISEIPGLKAIIHILP